MPGNGSNPIDTIPLTREQLTLISALVFALGTALRGWWYPAAWVNRMLDEKDQQIAYRDAQNEILRKSSEHWQDLALKLLHVNDRVINLVETTKNAADKP